MSLCPESKSPHDPVGVRKNSRMGGQDLLTRIVTVLPFDSRLFTATRAMIGRARRHSYATRGPETRQAGFISCG
jgi:hypothetical protein